MTESPRDMLDRLKLIASGERECDLSENDEAALWWIIAQYEAKEPVDVQGVAAIAWRCIRECKDYDGPPVMCPAHQQEAHTLVGYHGTQPVSGASGSTQSEAHK